jgi:hypothetical protein
MTEPVPDKKLGATIYEMLGRQCPLCANGLSDHLYGSFAGMIVNSSDIPELQRAREIVLTADPDQLPQEGENDADVIFYAILRCPITGGDAVIEHYMSGIIMGKLWSQVLPNVSEARKKVLAERVQQWYRF